MGCVSSAPSDFFNASIGLRQGCPLSSFLFSLVAEGLSRLILKAKREGAIKDIRVASSIYISHLFVDDTMLLGHGSLRQLKHYKTLLDTYCGMEEICIVFNGLGTELEEQIS
jgi:hypothetical protein